MITLFLKWLGIGGIGGILFGISFGLIASIFKNGPPVGQAIAESWWWFALVGCCIGIGYAYTFRRDITKNSVIAKS